MTTAISRSRSCPFEDCPAVAQPQRSRLIRHATLKTRRGPRLRWLCKHCGRSFVTTRSTPYHRLRRSKADFDAVIALFAEGVSQASIARARGLSPSTVSRWLGRAAEHTRAFEDEHLAVSDPVEIQIDEVKSYGAAREQRAWIFNAIEVWSRLWLTTRVGPRTLRNTLVFARLLRRRSRSIAVPVLVTSDEFKYYLNCLRRTFGPSCVYVQVKNRYARGRITHTRAKRLIGNEWNYEQARERSEDSQRPNTAYIERLNLHLRRTCAYLNRRTPSPMRKPQRLAESLDVNRLVYNFVRGHSSLRFGGKLRTPAMQAGITKRPLTLREIFLWRRPPSKYPPPGNWSPTSPPLTRAWM
jgi:transposase-like protein/IS1 family transposase